MDSRSELLGILQSSRLPEQSFGFDQPYETYTFKEHVSNVETNISKSISLLNSVEWFEDPSIRKDIVINTVLLCGEHSENNVWASRESIHLSCLLLNNLLNKCNCSNLPELLIQFTCDSFLSKLRLILKKSSWKNYPAAVSCFKWMLTNIKCPHLGDLLSEVLPTCLLLVDDHEYSNKAIGLHCLQHVAANVSRTELAQYGRGAVIYKALEHMIYLREAEIIRRLASCLVVLLSSTECQPHNVSLTWNHFDDVLSIWLPCMEMEQQSVLREAYMDGIDPLIAAMGLSSVRWSRKLLGVLSEYCEQENTKIKALQGEMTEEMKQMTKILRNTCITDTGVTEDAIDATNRGIFAEDEKLKCYMKCLYVNLGVFSEEDSSLDLAALIGMAPENMRELFKDMLTKCSPLSGNNDCEKTFNFNKCIYKQAPEKYMAI